MSFPGESKLEFVSILPFTPSNRNNLIGWLGARSDGDEYGKLRSYHFPKTGSVDGPLLIQARIDQNSQLSSQLTLWNQQGSKVIRGNLLVIPLDDTLLFAEPIYLQADRSPMPELRLVVLATQDRFAAATNFDEALKLLLAGGGTETTAPAETPVTTAGLFGPTHHPLLRVAPRDGCSRSENADRPGQPGSSDYRKLTALVESSEKPARSLMSCRRYSRKRLRSAQGKSLQRIAYG